MIIFWLCLVIVIAQGALSVLALRHYLALPHVPLVPRRVSNPRVSIIIPARDEAANLGRLLPSLLNLDYAQVEIIVVDDQSTDATAALASEFDALIVRSPGPPPGWSGKNYACHLGAMAATGEWLLFTDADTEHMPQSLASVMGYVQDRQLDAVSLLLGQTCISFWERALLPFAYQQYFVGVPGATVNDPRSSAALANGQYILLRRRVYEQIGGHEAVRSSLVEDVRLAHLMKSLGVRFGVARAEGLVYVRMYRGLREIWNGFSKNSFQFLTLDPKRGMLVMLSTALAALTPSLLSQGWQQNSQALTLMAGYSYAFLALGLMAWDRLFRVPVWYGLLQPLSAMTFVLIAMNSAVRSLTGSGVSWKGRVYGRRAAPSEHPKDRTRTEQRPPQG